MRLFLAACLTMVIEPVLATAQERLGTWEDRVDPKLRVPEFPR